MWISLANLLHLLLNDFLHGYTLLHTFDLLLEEDYFLVDFVSVGLDLRLLPTPLLPIIFIHREFEEVFHFDYVGFLFGGYWVGVVARILIKCNFVYFTQKHLLRRLNFLFWCFLFL